MLLKENPDDSLYDSQLSLFGEEANATANWVIDPVTKEPIPAPVREYPPTDYRRLADNA